MARCDSVDRFKEILQQDFSGHLGTNELVRVVDDAMALKDKRDRLIHGAVASASPQDQDLLPINNSGKDGCEEAPISHPDLIWTASAIDELALRLMQLDMSYGERLSATTIRANAWRHAARMND
ncbi:MAG: hypothetical protein ABWZ57_15895 [Mesorhizobium sp.]